MRYADSELPRRIQQVGSLLLLAALGGFVYGFFQETPLALVERPLTRRAIYWSLFGVLMHAAVFLPPQRASHSTDGAAQT